MQSELLEQLIDGQNLSMEQASSVMNEIMDGKLSDSQFGSIVTALRIKGETSDEVAGMATTMRSRSLKISSSKKLVDTCGTGGDGSGTFNVSTTAAFVVAGSGQPVAKHGNRAMSSSSGSADVLEEIGATIELNPEQVEQCLLETGFAFMFAQTFHPSMKFAAIPRKELGIRTVFNILGPLTNPANAEFQIIGIGTPEVGGLMINVLKKLGAKRAMVLHGTDGLDEISLSAPTRTWELKNNKIIENEISPENFGMNFQTKDSVNDSISVTGIKESARVMTDVLSGKKGPARDITILNAAAALYISNNKISLLEASNIASDSIDSGAAKNTMELFVSRTNGF